MLSFTRMGAPSCYPRLVGPLRFSRSVGVVILSSCLLAVPQQSPPVTASGLSTAASKTILISVQNKDGTPAELSSADLQVKIDGKDVSVHDIHRLSLALHYCLLFDTSGSQKARFKEQQDEAIAFLSRVPQPGRDYGTMVTFNDRAFLDAEGVDPRTLIASITKENPVGGTALYDAIISCANRLAKSSLDSPQRFIFLFSDGEDNSSRLTLDKTAALLAETGVRFYAIGDFEERRAELAMKHLAQASGGNVFFARKAKDTDSAMTEISAQISSLFLMTLADTPRADHPLRLEMKCLKKEMSVLAPRAIYIPAQ